MCLVRKKKIEGENLMHESSGALGIECVAVANYLLQILLYPPLPPFMP